MNLHERFQESDIVFIGKVTEIDPAPTAASGAAVVFRGVEYDVIGTMKGHANRRSVKIFHYVVSDMRDMQPSNSQDPVTPFRLGARHMVFSIEGKDVFNNDRMRLEELNSDDGILELSDDIVVGLRRAMSPPRNLFAVLRWLFLGR